MVSIDTLRKLALSLPETTEQPHFDKISFRVKNKIFATYDEHLQRASIKLNPTDQYIFSAIDDTVIHPVDNRWGRQGWTWIEMRKVKKTILTDALQKAYCEVAPARLAREVTAPQTGTDLERAARNKMNSK